MGVAGGGTNIFRGHDNVQGATDMGLDVTTLPAYYGLVEGAWKHWCRVWGVDYEWVKGQFADKAFMEKSGIPVSRWFDGVLEDKANLDQPNNVKAMVFWGHAPNSQTRGPDMKRAMEKLDLLLVVDPHPTVTAILSDRTDGVYLLPSTTQMECSGSVTASNRSLQWREQVIEPRFESKTDHEIMYLLARKFGYADELCKNIQVQGTVPVVEDILREINRGAWSIGYTGQSPERLKLHMANQHTFDKTTLRAVGGPCDGDFYGLPWPCWGTPEMKHPGTANLYDTSLPVKDGGLGFRANFGVERDGQNLLAEGSWPKGSEIEDGYPEFSMEMLTMLGWEGDLTRRGACHGRQGRRAESQLEDRPLRRHPAGGDQARLRAVRQRQGTLRGVDLPRSRAAASRAALHPAARSRGPVPDLGRPQAQPPAAALQVDPGQGLRHRLPDDPDLRATGRVRRRRRRDPLERLAGRAAADDVHRGQPVRRQQSGRARRRHGLGARPRRCAGSGSWRC